MGGGPDEDIPLAATTQVEGEDTRRVLQAESALLPLTVYDLLGPDCTSEQTVLTTFTTGGGADLQPPLAGTASWDCTRVLRDLEPVGTCETRMDMLLLTHLQLDPATDDVGPVFYEFFEDATTPNAFHVTAGIEHDAAELSGPPGDYGWASGLSQYPMIFAVAGRWRIVAVDMAGNRSQQVVLDTPDVCEPGMPDAGLPADAEPADASTRDAGPAGDASTVHRGSSVGCLAAAPAPGPPAGAMAVVFFLTVASLRRRAGGGT